MNKHSASKELLHLFLEWLMGTAGVLGSLFCLITAFQLTPPRGLLWLAGLGMLLLLSLFRLRRGRLAAVVTGLCLAAGLWLGRETLVPAAVALWDHLADHYSLGYDIFRTIHPELVHPAPDAAGAALLALAGLQTWICALSLARWRRTWPAALVLLLGISPCFILLDTPPALWALLTAVVSLLLQILTQSARRREDRETGRAFLWAALVTGLCLALLLAAFPRESFRAPLTWEELANEFSSLGQKLNNRGNYSAGLSGNPAEVDLENLLSLPNRSSPVMQVTSDYRGTLYLRGSAYNRFTGSTWERGEEREWDESVLYPYLRFNGQSYSSYYLPIYQLSVKTTYREVQLFTAYEAMSLPPGGVLTGDEYLRNADRRTAYTMTFTQPYQVSRSGGVNLDMSGLNPEYEQWVQDNCLELPEETRQGVLDWWQRQTGWDVSDVQATGESAITVDGFHIVVNPGSSGFDSLYMPYDADWTAQTVAEQVSQCASYSRNPETLPEGADFCTWFLNEAETGYCVHYATAAVALLRAMGIPARYVTGYVANSVPGKSTEISNIQAHAWVEYFHLGRWHMLEVTPGDATEFTGVMPAGSETTDPSKTETEATEPSETRRPVAPETDYMTPTDTVVPSEARPIGGPDPQDPAGKSEPWTVPAWLWIPLGLLALWGLAELRLRLSRLSLARKLARTGNNGKAVLLYRRCRRLSRLTRVEIKPETTRIAEKAVFSPHTLTDQELETVRDNYSLLVACAQVAKGWRRLYYRYVLALV